MKWVARWRPAWAAIESRIDVNGQHNAMTIEQAVEQAAQRYREEGYEVIVHPQGDQVPAFAAGFELDIVATRHNEGVIVKVKPGQYTAAESTQLTRLAAITNKQPGWRFDLVVEADNPFESLIREAEEPSIDDIRAGLDEAQRLADLGSDHAAFLVVWTALEATMRRVSRLAGLGGRRGTSPRVLIRELYSSGYMAPEDFQRIEDAARVRVEVVHGFKPPRFDPQMVRYLIELTDRLLAEEPKIPLGAGSKGD